MLLEVSHLSVRYDKAVLVNDVSLSVEKGELVALVGPNGAGKSTTLRAISGLAPLIRQEVFEKISEINRMGITILLVEQEVSTVFKMSTRNYVLSSGKIIAQGTAEELLQNEVLRKSYLGL